MTEPQEVIISITSRCNLKCRMCDIPLTRQEEQPAAVWKEVIEDALFLGVRTVVFSGGEPLLRPDLPDLIACVRNKGLQACVTSNGLLIDKDMALKLAHSGVGVVNISVEGTRQTHDFLRGEGSFQKAHEALMHLKESGIESTVAVMISGYNFRELKSIVELARECKATTVKFQPFSSLFLKDASGTGAFLVPPEDLQELTRCIIEAGELCTAYGIATNPKEYLAQIPEYLISGKIPGKKGCNALFTSCPITSQGQVYPCWVMNTSSYLLGNVKEMRLSDIWSSSRRKILLEEIMRNGCPGCLMSCYDKEFKEQDLEARVSLHINRIRHKGFISWFTIFLRSCKRRFAFYRSYRGPLKKIVQRIASLRGKKKKLRLASAGDNARIASALQELQDAKKKLKEQLG